MLVDPWPTLTRPTTPPPFPKASPSACLERRARLRVKDVSDEPGVPESLCGTPSSAIKTTARILAAVAGQTRELERHAVVVAPCDRPADHAHGSHDASFISDCERKLVPYWRFVVPVVLTHERTCFVKVARHHAKLLLAHAGNPCHDGSAIFRVNTFSVTRKS